jgi:hypothetical protein
VLFVLLGLIIAFLSNLGRTLLLCWIAAKDGIESVSNWHDPAGFSVLGICFLVLWALAGLLFGNPPKLQSSQTSGPVPHGLLIGLGAWIGERLLSMPKS